MTTVLFFLSLVAFSTATPLQESSASRSISSGLEDTILSLRDKMSCGFPQFGIPPLAPFVISHTEVKIDTPTLAVAGTLENFQVNGLNEFEVIKMRVNVIKKKVTFRFHFKNVNVDSLYDFELFLKKAGFTINMIGAGQAKFAIDNLEIWGSLKYSYGIISTKVKLKSLDARVHIDRIESDIQGVLGDGEINHLMNEVLQEAIKWMINKNEDLISKTIESRVLPIANNVLRNYTLADLLSIINNSRMVGGVRSADETIACVTSNP